MKKYVAIAPEGCEYYLTPGKEYPATIERETEYNGKKFKTVSDLGLELVCLEFECAHLKFKNWTIKEVK